MTDTTNLDPLQPSRRKLIYRGMGILWGVNLLHLVIGLAGLKLAAASIGLTLIIFYPLVALVYGAIMLIAFREQEGVFKGMVIAYCVTILLSCTCWMVVANGSF